MADLFELSAVLGLDISPYQTAINSALGIANGFGSALESAFGTAVDFMGDVFETGMGFDKQMSAVQAVLGREEGTVENMTRLRQNALEVAEDSIFTSKEMGDAYYYMGMAGWKTEQLLSGLPGVVNLAAASGEDLKSTSDIVTDALTAFGLGAGQATHFADVLAQTATNANTDVARMGKTFQYLAPIAGALGYSVEDVALSIGLVADSGIKGTMAGTSLRNIFTRIATNAGQTEKDLGALDIVAEKLGVSFYDASGRARDWGDVLSEMRAAWKKLDPQQVDKVTKAFGDFSVESQSSSDIMAEFAADLDNWQTVWNGLTTDAERESFAKELEPQFEALGISMRDSNGNLREFNQVAGDTRVMLGGLTDEEQIYYAKQIGSLRGISALITLMTASESDVNKLKEAIENAGGAAAYMASVRLDNLWGDLQLFNAAYDVLKVAIFDETKGPVREIIQEGTRWIQDITDAIGANGLAGGIDMLATHIEMLADDKHMQELLGSIGNLLGGVVDGIIDRIIDNPKIGEAVNKLIGSFLGGAGEGLMTSGDPVSGLLGLVVGGAGGIFSGTGNIIGALFGSGDVEKARSKYAQSLRDTVSPETREYAAGEFTNIWTDDFDTWQLTDKMFNDFQEADDSVADDLEDSITTGGTDGGATAAVNMEDIMASTFTNAANMLVTDMGSAGISAGDALADAMQQELSNRTFGITVQADVSGPIQHNARAMGVGRIFRRPTIFGYADGAFQEAGDAGAEAVVGVNSLQSMIANAVRSANAGSEVFVPREAQSRPVTVIMQVGEKEFGRLAFELGSAEEQRVGVRLAKGGAY